MYDSEYGFMGARGWRGGHRARRGDMVPIILRVLLEKPMHGYEIISHLEERSHGMWRPSAGSIYPNLQLLEERGLVTSQSEDGKKIYTLTAAGKEAAEKIDEKFTNWEHKSRGAQQFRELKEIIGESMYSLHQIARQDSEEKIGEVKKILEETRDKLKKIEAEE